MEHTYRGFRIITMIKYGLKYFIICGNVFKFEPSELTGHREQMLFSKFKDAKKAVDIYLETGKVKWNAVAD